MLKALCCTLLVGCHLETDSVYFVVYQVNQLSLGLHGLQKNIKQPQDECCRFPCDNLPAESSNKASSSLHTQGSDHTSVYLERHAYSLTRLFRRGKGVPRAGFVFPYLSLQHSYRATACSLSHLYVGILECTCGST